MWARAKKRSRNDSTRDPGPAHPSVQRRGIQSTKCVPPQLVLDGYEFLRGLTVGVLRLVQEGR